MIMIIVAGVGLYLGSNDSPSVTATTPTTTTIPTTTMPTATTTTTPATTTPQMTLEEQTYKIIIENRISIINQALDAIRELMANSQISDSQWRVNVFVQLAMIQSLYDDAVQMSPPVSMADIHDKYVQAVEQYKTTTHLLTQGIEELDVTLIEQATVGLFTGTGTQLLIETIELLNEFIAAHAP